ncbi:hypothetical protein P7K49_014586 [Saguinus oedipus]|uniref:Uncharacterized protein n=1 Tax=Saguinus oedipus TaxID=9490 RepID=A0ABQ9V774_SAGOE|nr:hypothetical protein P7K49_014586 [Saguinus oedipus]
MVNAASHGDPEAQRARAMCAQGYTVMQQKAQSPPKAWAVPLCPGAAAPPSSPVYSLADSYQPSQSLQAAMDVCHRGVFLVASITPAPAVTDGFFIWPPVNPCKLHCQPSNEYFAEKLWDAVVDGTLCYQGRVSWDLCINGICKTVGCDFEIDSGAMEDHYGMCHDNGSTCHTVSGTLEEAKGLAGYVDVGLVPASPHEICIQEVAEAAKFLALQSEDLKKNFFNGGWTIQWDADYQVAGTTFTYACRGNWENLTSLGHTKEPVWIQVPVSRGPGQGSRGGNPRPITGSHHGGVSPWAVTEPGSQPGPPAANSASVSPSFKMDP